MNSLVWNCVREELNLLIEHQVVTLKWLHIFSSASCGKSTKVKDLLLNSSISHAFVNCLELCTDNKTAFNLIAQKISVSCGSKRSKKPIKTADDFVTVLSDVLSDSALFLLVLDNVETITSLKLNLLDLLLNLGYYVEMPLKLVLMTIGKVPYLNLTIGNPDCTYPIPVQINVAPPSEEEISEIIFKIVGEDLKNSETAKLRNMCAKYLARAYSDDLLKLQYTTEKKLVPLLQDFDVKLSGMDVTPSLTSVFKVFQKVVTQEYRLVCTQKEAERKSQTSFDCTLPVLPLISKVLLTAAFIASFNPPSSDARYFLKKSEKKRVTARQSIVSDFKTQFYKGPKSFALERLLLITAKMLDDLSCADENMHFSNDVLSQIATLCDHGMLQKGSNDKSLESVKYKCLCPIQTIQKLATSLNFKLGHYLHNYH